MMTDYLYGPPDDIRSPRLLLRRLTPELMRMGLAGEREAAECLLGAAIPVDLIAKPTVLHYGLARLAEDPAYAPWGARAVILASERRMVGHVRFHSRPNPPYLRALVRNAVEIGYTIFAADRRQGYGTEAARTMLEWAHAQHGVRRFVASVAPGNAASLALIGRLGFQRIGEHIDEVDGLEHIFLCKLARK
jgi:RimJ/RimL family protein N-acetyltransferase